MTGYANSEPVRRDEPHHYVLDTDYCPVCGRERTIRTRVAGPPPEPTEDNPYPTDRIRERYDYCDL